MLTLSRNTTEQRSHMDAVELGNDFGSLPAAGANGFSPAGEGLSSATEDCRQTSINSLELWRDGRHCRTPFALSGSSSLLATALLWILKTALGSDDASKLTTDEQQTEATPASPAHTGERVGRLGSLLLSNTTRRHHLKSPSCSSADANTLQLLRTLERKENALLKLSKAGRHPNAPWKIA